MEEGGTREKERVEYGVKDKTESEEREQKNREIRNRVYTEKEARQRGDKSQRREMSTEKVKSRGEERERYERRKDKEWVKQKRQICKIISKRGRKKGIINQKCLRKGGERKEKGCEEM